MMGPDPMMSTDLMLVSLGMASGGFLRLPRR